MKLALVLALLLPLAMAWSSHSREDELGDFLSFIRNKEDSGSKDSDDSDSDSRDKDDSEYEEEKKMEALKRKKWLLEKMVNVTNDLKEQKMQLTHDVTFRFMEFCQCSQSSSLIKKFFMRKFGDMSYRDEWSEAIKWDKEDSPFSLLLDMGKLMDDDDDDDDDENERSMGNSTARPAANSTAASHEDDDEEMDATKRMMWQKIADKFSDMDEKEISKELFNGMVNTMCKAASKFIGMVQKFEMFYVEQKAKEDDRDDSSPL